MKLASQDKLAQVRCMQMLRSERTYVLGFANETSSLAVLVCGFSRVNNNYGTEIFFLSPDDCISRKISCKKRSISGGAPEQKALRT